MHFHVKTHCENYMNVKALQKCAGKSKTSRELNQMRELY